jgi:hypothetical protein
MDYLDLLKLKKEAPLLIREYEMRKRSVNAQLLLLDSNKHTDPEAAAILGKWVGANNTWLTTNQERYYQALKLVRFTDEELIELHHQQQESKDDGR